MVAAWLYLAPVLLRRRLCWVDHRLFTWWWLLDPRLHTTSTQLISSIRRWSSLVKLFTYEVASPADSKPRPPRFISVHPLKFLLDAFSLLDTSYILDRYCHRGLTLSSRIIADILYVLITSITVDYCRYTRSLQSSRSIVMNYRGLLIGLILLSSYMYWMFSVFSTIITL